MVQDIKIVKSHRRSIALHIEPDGTVIVKAPKLMLNFQIRHFIDQHQDWIEKHVEKRKSSSKKRIEGEYLLLGQTLRLQIGKFSKISVENDELLFPEALVFRKEKEIHSFYIREAREIISKQTEWYAEKMRTSFKEITFSDTRSQWGRCTHDNRLQFNWRLVMAPLLVINYVVIHELAHTMEKNHTQMFWMKVRGQMPSYRQQIKWLKENGASLRI